MNAERTDTPPPSDPPPRTTGGGFRWEPPSAEELQNLMPGYTIEKILGRGGMGAVYRGVQTNLDRPVAIKILPPGVEKEDPSFAERFKNEAKLMAKLMHPGVVAVFDFGKTSAGQLYFVMEYVDGSDVSQMIAAQGRLPPEHALAITAHVCDALQAAHELGIVHRDIKPANVLINMKGQVKVADFGLAKVEEPGSHGLTKTGYAMGTPDFVAPEALMLGTAIDGRADLYAVGVMLYQMLTGNIPRGAFKPASVLVPGLDPRFDAIIVKAMQHDRAERHQSAAELRRELDVILTVPFVRNDAPVSAAIPVAQVAQAPGQRSAVAQKPVGKPPQGGVGTPARNQTSGGAAATKDAAGKSARAPLPPAKSKAPLFIGLGAAAAIGIGAFVMLGGGKTAKQSAPLTPSSGTSVVTTPKPAPAPPKPAPTAPSPNVSKSSSSSTASQSSEEKFPPGQWVKVFTKFEDLPASTRSEDPGLKVIDGWLTPTKQIKLSLDSLKAKNLGIRAVFKGTATPILSLGEARSGSYKFQGPSNNNELLLMDSMSYPETRLASKRLSLQAPQIKEIAMEFYVLSGRCFAKSNEVTLVHPLTRGTIVAVPGLEGKAAVRDIEVINLDGLSEAEALKILGVDEKGNDLRQKPAAVASATPAASSPTPAAAKSAMAPASSSPSLPISQSSDPKFPPGQWVKVFTKFEDLPVELRNADVRFVDGWIKIEGNTRQVLILPVQDIDNHAIRVRVRREAIPAGRAAISLKSVDKGRFTLGTPATSSSINKEMQIQRVDDEKTVELARIQRPNPKESGQEDELEFAILGKRLISRIGTTFVRVLELDKPIQKRGPAYISGTEDLRDIEVINLDGLPEAEALRILGVDEKGNDLRALAAKQEQQKAEMAKQADAMAAIPELKALHEQFVKLQGERVTAPFEAEVAKLNAGYVGGIDREIANEKKAGHLDGVIALEAEKKLIADKQPVPAADDEKATEALKKLRGIYRTAYAKLEATRAENLKALTDPLSLRLKQLESTLTQQNRIDHAKTVREYREGLGKDGSAGTPARTSSTGGAAATMNEAGKSARAPLDLPKRVKVKPDPDKSRLAAEYALSKGCEVSIDRDGVIIPIKKLEDLPKGRWGLHRVKFLTPVTDEDLNAVTRAVELKEFVCSDRVSPGTFTSLAPLGNTPELTHLILNRADRECSTEDAAALLQSAETLRQLTWLLVDRNDALVSVVTACKNLDYLLLNGTALTDDDMERLRALPLLQSLMFRGTKLTDAGARHLAKLKPLKRLTITDSFESGVTPLMPEGLAVITKTHGDTLAELNIGSYGSPHTEGMLRVIAQDCPVLESLTLRGEASPEALAGLAKLKRLKRLDFGRITNKPIPLSVAHCQAISGIKSLETIGAYDCDLTDAHVQALAALKSLKFVNLNRNPGITDASVPVFLGFQDLETLSIGNTRLTPAGFLKLTGLKKLKSLGIGGEDITEAHIAQLKTALPGCSITR
jgi:serine/threonine protein kinase